MINRRRHRDRLVQQHMGFARGLAKRLGQSLPPHVDADALESDALLGLLMAARSFDPERGVAFTTYAAKRIHGAMLDGLRGRQGCSRGRRPPVVMSLAKRVLDTDGREVTLGDVLSENQEPVGAALECHEQVEHLLSCVQTTERRMVREYYFDELTQDEIGARHGMSASRVSQRLKAACERMREVACAN
jgi:RNA polymerase sigma factor (sigma-70 family)